MAYTDIDDPAQYFNTVLYTGNGGTQSITGVGFQPDWIWTKGRSGSRGHTQVDSIRGATKTLESATDSAEETHSNSITAIGSDGFSLGNRNQGNANTETFVSWNWKAGTAFSNDASSTGIGSRDSAGTVSTTAGISIMGWTGDDGADTLAHGLGVVPTMYILKSRGQTGNWIVYHEALGAEAWIELDATDAKSTSGSQYRFNDTAPTSTVFSVGATGAANDDEGMIAYIFAEKKGFSKFGSYVGNGDANGTFVHTGFKPAFVLGKSSTLAGQHWFINDNKRGINGGLNWLKADASDAELTNLVNCDFLSNGFKLRNNNDIFNDSAQTFIYMAFAESPFVNSNGIPNNAG